MSVKKAFALGSLFLLSFIIFAVALFPASIALNLAAKQLPPGLQLGPASGTIWQGQINGVRYQGQYLSKAQWQVNAWALLTGKAQVDVTLGNKRNPEELSAGGVINYGLIEKDLTVTDANARIRIEQALAQVQLPIPTQARGRIFVDIAQYQLGQPHCQVLAGEISSPDITVKGRNGWFSIGELEGQLACKNGGISVKVDKENRLGLQVDAGLNERSQLTASGFVKPDASLPKDVHDAVQFLGNQTSDGRYRINF